MAVAPLGITEAIHDHLFHDPKIHHSPTWRSRKNGLAKFQVNGVPLRKVNSVGEEGRSEQLAWA